MLEACGTNMAFRKVCTAVCDGLVCAIDEIRPQFVPLMCNRLVNCVTADYISGRALELLPKVLANVSSQQRVSLPDRPEMSGITFKTKILEALCEHEWPPECVSHLAAVLLDVPLDPEQLALVLETLLSSLSSHPVEEVPPLVYQLLLLCNKGQKQKVLRKIIDHIGSLTPDGSDAMAADGPALTKERLRPVQGTCILHISFAAKQDQELGKEFVKYLKSGVKLTTFSLALALALARIHRFETQIFDLVKNMISKSFREKERESKSRWISELSSVAVDVELLFEEAVDACTFGWDQAIHGLLLIGFALMDTYKLDTNPSASPSPAHRVCRHRRRRRAAWQEPS